MIGLFQSKLGGLRVDPLRLGVPYRTPCIHPDDFNITLPSLEDDEELTNRAHPQQPMDYPRPIHWQMAMIKIAESHYALHQRIRIGVWSESNAAALVFQTDEKIAKVISELPPWFSAEVGESVDGKFSNETFPWLKAQRARTYLMAYEARINIYSLLLNLKSNTDDALLRARSIYLASSRTTINLSLSLSDEIAKSWYD